MLTAMLRAMIARQINTMDLRAALDSLSDDELTALSGKLERVETELQAIRAERVGQHEH